MIKSFLRSIRDRFSIVDGKLCFDYTVATSYDTSRKAELLITRDYRSIIIGFEPTICASSRQFIEGIRINSYCLLGVHVSFTDMYTQVIETVEGRILNASTRELIRMKVAV